MSKLDAVTFSFDCCHLAGRFDDVKHKKADPSHGDRPSAEPESPWMTFFRADYHGTDYYVANTDAKEGQVLLLILLLNEI